MMWILLFIASTVLRFGHAFVVVGPLQRIATRPTIIKNQFHHRTLSVGGIEIVPSPRHHQKHLVPTTNTKFVVKSPKHSVVLATTSSSSNDFASTTIASTTTDTSITSTTSREDAIAALQKLVQRQNEEVQETLMLLSRLTDDQQQQYDDGNDIDDDYHGPLLTNTAASLLSGVDYGFQSRSEGARNQFLVTEGGDYQNGNYDLQQQQPQSAYGPPANIWLLGSQQFMRNWNAMKGEYNDELSYGNLTTYQIQLQQSLQELTLNTSAIWEREKMDNTNNPLSDAPWTIKIPYYVLCYFLDVLFEGKYVFNRFFLLETVARMPYFSYITMLHLYETLGFWRRSADVKRIHFAEEINEYRHLLIQESLGGDQQWYVRFLAQHSAIVYYIGLCLLWAISPTLSYKFSEMLETHAVHTYGQFIDENEEKLKQLPPSLAAVEYYTFGSSDPFYAEFQTSALAQGKDIRRPGTDMKSLYDVFKAIQADEADHVSTMQACLDPNTVLRSLSIEKQALLGVALATITAVAVSATGGGVGLEGVYDSTTTTLSNLVADEGIVGVAEAVGIIPFINEILSRFSNEAAVEDTAELGTLLREMDMIGAVGIFLVSVRRFLQDVWQLLIRFVTLLFK